jgi:hypothetical protein
MPRRASRHAKAIFTLDPHMTSYLHTYSILVRQDEDRFCGPSAYAE